MITTYTFPNGLRLVMEKTPHVRSVSLGIWIGTGSRYETVENNGISHFIEHMLFKGTKTRSAREIAETFDSIGGNLNAFTSKEYTCYYAKVLDEHVPLAFEVLADMFFNSLFEEEELEKEKNVILEELKMYEDAPDEVVHDLIAKATYMQHSLGYPIIGEEEILKSVTYSNIQDYMKAHYTPANTVISVVGNINEEHIIELAKKYFDLFDSRGESPAFEAPEISTKQLTRVKETEQAHFCLGFKGLSIGDPDLHALAILNNILGGSMSSRLFQEIREERGLTYSIFSYYTCYRDIGSVHIYGGTTVHQLEQVYELCLSVLHALIERGVTAKELHNTKEQVKGNLMLSLESTSSRMNRLGKNELLLGRHLSLDEVIAKINCVTLEDIHRLAVSLFQQKHSFALVSTAEHVPSSIHPERLLV